MMRWNNQGCAKSSDIGIMMEKVRIQNWGLGGYEEFLIRYRRQKWYWGRKNICTRA